MPTMNETKTFDYKLEQMIKSARQERERLEKLTETAEKLSFDVLAQFTPVAQMRKLFNELQESSLTLRWISVYGTNYGDKPEVIFDVTYEVEAIRQIEPVLEYLTEEYALDDWKDEDGQNGRTYTAVIPFPDYNIRLSVMAWVKNAGSEGDCFRVIEKAEAITSEIKTYRWICK